MAIRLSILDQTPIYPGESAAEAFAHTIRLAQRSEEWGYHRFWVSEHHDSAQLAGSSPEVLISHLLAKTSSIRLGSGGVMLQHYSPYKVAENFNVLASLAPGRVDVGIGRAPGGLPRSTQALQRDLVNPPTLTEKLKELEVFLREGRLAEPHPLAGLQAAPIPAIAPELYVLGASTDSAELAADLGLPYVFSLFINGDEQTALEAIRRYRNRFSRSASPVRTRSPQAILALAVLVAETDEEAEELIGQPQKLVKIHLASGKKLTVGTLEQAQAFAQQSDEPYTIEETELQVVKGSKETVRRKLLALQEASGVDEFIVTTNVKPFEKRLRSFELLREAFAEVSLLSQRGERKEQQAEPGIGTQEGRRGA